MAHIFKVVKYFQLNSKSCETASSSNVQGDEVETCGGWLKNVIDLCKKNLITNKISLVSKGLNFVPTSIKVDVARLKLQYEQFGRMLYLKWNFRIDKSNIPI